MMFASGSQAIVRIPKIGEAESKTGEAESLPLQNKDVSNSANSRGKDSSAPKDFSIPICSDSTEVLKPVFVDRHRSINIAGHNLPHWEQRNATCFVTWRTADSLPQGKLAELAAEQEAWRTAHPEFLKRLAESGIGEAESKIGEAESLPLLNKDVSKSSNSGGKDSSAPKDPSAPTDSSTPAASSAPTDFPPAISSDLNKEYRELFYGRVQKWLDSGMGACALRDVAKRREVESAIMHFDGVRYIVYAYVVMPNHVHVLFMPLGDNRASDIVASWKRFSAKRVNAISGNRGEFWQKESWDYLVRGELQFRKFVRYILNNNPKIAWNVWGLAEV